MDPIDYTGSVRFHHAVLAVLPDNAALFDLIFMPDLWQRFWMEPPVEVWTKPNSYYDQLPNSSETVLRRSWKEPCKVPISSSLRCLVTSVCCWRMEKVKVGWEDGRLEYYTPILLPFEHLAQKHNSDDDIIVGSKLVQLFWFTLHAILISCLLRRAVVRIPQFCSLRRTWRLKTTWYMLTALLNHVWL